MSELARKADQNQIKFGDPGIVFYFLCRGKYTDSKKWNIGPLSCMSRELPYIYIYLYNPANVFVLIWHDKG